SRDLRIRGNAGHIVPARWPLPVTVLQVNREDVERSRVNEKCLLSLKRGRHTSPCTEAYPKDGNNCRHRHEANYPCEKHSDWQVLRCFGSRKQTALPIQQRTDARPLKCVAESRSRAKRQVAQAGRLLPCRRRRWTAFSSSLLRSLDMLGRLW